jgi:hypothetical protein
LIFELFLIENGHGPGPLLGGPRAAPVHGGLQTGPRWWLARGRSERRPGLRNLTAVEEKRGRDGGDTHRLQEGRRRGGTSWASVGKKWQRRRSVRAVLGRGEKRRGEGRGAVESGDGPLYIGAEGEATIGD